MLPLHSDFPLLFFLTALVHVVFFRHNKNQGLWRGSSLSSWTTLTASLTSILWERAEDGLPEAEDAILRRVNLVPEHRPAVPRCPIILRCLQMTTRLTRCIFSMERPQSRASSHGGSPPSHLSWGTRAFVGALSARHPGLLSVAPPQSFAPSMAHKGLATSIRLALTLAIPC